MFKDVGRLALRDIKENEEKIEKIFNFLDEDKIEQAKASIIKLLSTPNYFIREFIGKKLVEYKDGEKMDQVILSFLGHKTYGVRAATIFYYFSKYSDSPQKIMTLLKMSWCDTPWETEHILHEMWNKYPVLMKEEMKSWVVSESDKQKALAYHGMESVATDDPIYILNLIEKNIDFDNVDVQKKISNVLTHVIRTKPAECLPYIREWFTSSNDTRVKTLYLAMKKLISIAIQYGKSNKNEEFNLLIMHAINDWKSDPDKAVANIGAKLVNFSKKPNVEESENPST